MAENVPAADKRWTNIKKQLIANQNLQKQKANIFKSSHMKASKMRKEIDHSAKKRYLYKKIYEGFYHKNDP